MNTMSMPLAALALALVLGACGDAATATTTSDGKEEVSGAAPAEAPAKPAAKSTTAEAESADASFPPIPEGYYAVEATCAEAASYGDAYLYFDRKNWVEIDGSSEVTSITPAGGKDWKLVLDGGGPPLTISITGPDSFTEYGRRMVHCPTSSVPAQAQQDFGPAG